MTLITSSGTTDFILLLVLILFVLYKWSTRNFYYWKLKGVPYIEPVAFFGNMFKVAVFKATVGELYANFYNAIKTPFVGIYVYNRPALVVRDLSLIKSILVQDFSYFQDRNVLNDEKADPVCSKMLFLLKNPEWKLTRNRVSPAFTSGKLKNMISLMNEAGVEMISYLSKIELNRKNSLEMKELCAKFSTDVITSCAFGINAYSFRSENAHFRVVGRKLFDFTWMTAIRFNSYFLELPIVKWFSLGFFDPGAINFLKDVFWKTIEEREKNNFSRNDLIDVLINIKKQETISDSIKFEGDRVVAQAAQFFAAGFETISSTMAFALYELCLQPKIQERLRLEIKDSLSEGGSFTFESIQNMKYLHMVISETLRKYPVLPFLDRKCSENYKIPGSDVILEKGTPVYIPLSGIQYDPQYFPDPEVFDPERFSDDNKNNIPAFSVLPFGGGPRICIGERFGLVVTKLGLAHILSAFEVTKNSETPVPIKFTRKTLILASTVGLPMSFRSLSSVAA